MFSILRPNVTLELDEGERILYYTRRHWVLLLMRVAAPLGFAVLALLLAAYRALGGVFFALDAAPEGQLADPFNIVVLVLIAAMLLWWTRRSQKNKKAKPNLFVDSMVVLGVIVLAAVIYFRYQGGRVFSFDPAYARGGDIFNIALFLAGAVALAASIYILIDWANDFLILTNTRVIYDDTVLLVRHVQQAVLIENIQQVNLSAQSYLAHFLGYLALWRAQFLHWIGARKEPPPAKASAAYGKLVIGSLSLRRIMFDWAASPHVMEQQINAEIGKLKKQQEPELLKRIIEDQIYEDKRPKAPPPPIHVVERAGPIPWIFKPNPEINHEKQEVTWRPYWIFLLFAMLSAIVVLILATILLVVAARLGWLSGAQALGIWLPVALVCIGRIIWVREEHENDKYILQLDRIIDVDKKPFGPESSRSAQLGNIQNVASDVSFVQSIFGYGDVTIETGGGGGKFTFKHVPDPRNVQATINDYLTDFKKREKERQQQATLALLKQYHAVQSNKGELLNDEQRRELLARAAESLDVTGQVEREVASQVPDVVRRQVDGTLRRELWRNGLLRRRRS